VKVLSLCIVEALAKSEDAGGHFFHFIFLGNCRVVVS
jgi:hypothetical protein